METRRLFTAVAVALVVFLAYRTAYDWMYPPQEAPTRPGSPAATQPTGPTEPQVADSGDRAAPTSAAVATQTAPADAPVFSQAEQEASFALGGGPEDKLQIELTSRGAAISRILLAEQKDGKYVHRLDEETNQPYELIKPVQDPATGVSHASYLTRQILLGTQEYPLNDLQWQVARQDSHNAVFATTLRGADGSGDRLRITKTYALKPGSGQTELRLKFENLGDEQVDLSLQQDGPVGVTKENRQYDMRRLVRARREELQVEPKAYGRKDVADQIALGSSEEQFLWTALSNKYFAVFTRPLPRPGTVAVDYLQTVVGRVAIDGPVETDPADYVARMVTLPQKLAPGESTEFAFEIYAGTKNENDLEDADPAYADRTKIGYVAARDADQRCCCTFPWLTSFMTALLEGIQTVVRNYGVAIMVLVVIIRVLLHPLAVFQQKSMYRMQDAQARLKPKLDAIKEKYPNDKMKVNQETMKLYSEEGVNPMASMVGMLPMMVQMPILIALWTALNTDVHLRHAGFDPWWITDLSAPDALVEFPGNGVTIPILGWLPFIGRMFTNIPALNLLPILMGVSMWLQQKYMPKPGMDAKKDAAKKAAAENKPQRKSSGMSPEDQARQQQMMMYMMSIIFPLMFYNMPSGLNLYWMSTNVIGILESLRIRGQIKREKELREQLGPQPPKPKKTGPLGRLLKNMAARAEDLQKKADALSTDEKKRDKRPGGPGSR
jgi:YidC/Oxa1 family membrane protein insertase